MVRMIGVFLLLALVSVGAQGAEAIPVPAGEGITTFRTLWEPRGGSTLGDIRPLYWDTSGETYDMYVRLDQFDAAVDLYVILYFPVVDPDNFFVGREDTEIQNLTLGLVPWRAGVTTALDSKVLELNRAALETGRYYVAVVATPAESLSPAGAFTDYHFWITELAAVNIADYVPLAEGNRWSQSLTIETVPSPAAAAASGAKYGGPVQPDDSMRVELDIDSYVRIGTDEFIGGARTARIESSFGFTGNVGWDLTEGFTLYKTFMPLGTGSLEFAYDPPLTLFQDKFVLGAEYRFQTTTRLKATPGVTLRVSDGPGEGGVTLGDNETFPLGGLVRYGRLYSPDEPLGTDFLNRYRVNFLPAYIQLDQYLTADGMGTGMALPANYKWGLRRDWGWKSCFADFPSPGQDDLRVRGGTDLFLVDGVYSSRFGEVTGWKPSLELKYANQCGNGQEWADIGSYQVFPKKGDLGWTTSFKLGGQLSDLFSAEPESGTGDADVTLRARCGGFKIGDNFELRAEYRYDAGDFDASIGLPGTINVVEGEVKEEISVSQNFITGDFRFVRDCSFGVNTFYFANFNLNYGSNWSVDRGDSPSYFIFNPSSGIGDALVRLGINCNTVTTGDVDGSFSIDAPDASNSPFVLQYNVKVD